MKLPIDAFWHGAKRVLTGQPDGALMAGRDSWRACSKAVHVVSQAVEAVIRDGAEASGCGLYVDTWVPGSQQ